MSCSYIYVALIVLCFGFVRCTKVTILFLFIYFFFFLFSFFLFFFFFFFLLFFFLFLFPFSHKYKSNHNKTQPLTSSCWMSTANMLNWYISFFLFYFTCILILPILFLYDLITKNTNDLIYSILKGCDEKLMGWDYGISYNPWVDDYIMEMATSLPRWQDDYLNDYENGIYFICELRRR